MAVRSDDEPKPREPSSAQLEYRHVQKRPVSHVKELGVEVKTRFPARLLFMLPSLLASCVMFLIDSAIPPESSPERRCSAGRPGTVSSPRRRGRAHNNKLHPHGARPFTFYTVGNNDMWAVDELACTAASENEEANSLASE